MRSSESRRNKADCCKLHCHMCNGVLKDNLLEMTLLGQIMRAFHIEADTAGCPPRAQSVLLRLCLLPQTVRMGMLAAVRPISTWLPPGSTLECGGCFCSSFRPPGSLSDLLASLFSVCLCLPAPTTPAGGSGKQELVPLSHLLNLCSWSEKVSARVHCAAVKYKKDVSCLSVLPFP